MGHKIIIAKQVQTNLSKLSQKDKIRLFPALLSIKKQKSHIKLLGKLKHYSLLEVFPYKILYKKAGQRIFIVAIL